MTQADNSKNGIAANLAARFITAWLAAGGKETRTADLLELGLESGLPLSANVDRRAHSLGRWLANNANQPIKTEQGTFVIAPGVYCDGQQHWTVKPV